MLLGVFEFLLEVHFLQCRSFCQAVVPILFPWSESATAGSLIGQKLILNEFVAYVAFSDVSDGLSPITQAIVIFALCGFANLSSIAILLGGLGAIAPSRRDEISRLGVKALIAATLANLMSAALAGFFLSLPGAAG